MPTAFVTGGSGFIGGALIERLRAEGWDVRALARSDGAVRRPRVLGDPAVEGTRVVLLHGPGRPQPNSASITLRSSGSLADPRWMAPLMKNRGVLGIPLPAPLA